MELNFKKNIEGLELTGYYDVEGRFFRVNGVFLDKRVIDDQILSKTNDNYPFGYPGPNNEYILHGLLYYCEVAGFEYPQLKLNMSAPFFKEHIVVFPDGIPPIPPGPGPDPEPPTPLPSNPEKGVTITDINYRDLFPYLYIRPWPNISPRGQTDDFVSYGDTGAESTFKEFYNKLVQFKQNKDRTGMENEAVAFINGTSYTGQFVREIHRFETIMKDYTAIYDRIHRGAITFLTLTVAVQETIGTWKIVKEDIQKQDYKNEKERAWESFFALDISLGYDLHGLDQLVKTIVTAHLVETVAAVVPDDIKPVDAASVPQSSTNKKTQQSGEPEEKEKTSPVPKAVYMKTVPIHEDKSSNTSGSSEAPKEVPPEELPEPPESVQTEKNSAYLAGKVASPTYYAQIDEPAPTGELPSISMNDYDIARMANATILLPDQAFPMPPQNGSTTPNPSPPYIDGTEWMTPYAAGQLQMVRYRLRAYELGEISHIENILKGEIKEVSNRKLRQIKTQTVDNTNETSEKQLSREETSADLLNEINKTRFQQASNTAYTDNSGTGIGGWTVVDNPAGGHNNNIAKFAKDIVDRTVERISRTVNMARTRSTLEENEESVIHKFDNTGAAQGQGNLLGIYRWVNKIYTLKTVFWGNRLILEMMIDSPAENLIQNQQQYREAPIPQPAPPSSHGVFTYSDIVWDDSASPLYYLKLMEDYVVKDILPPPKKNLSVTASIEGIKPFNASYVEIPDGYESTEAYVTLSSNADPKITAEIMVGKVQKPFPVSAFSKSSPPTGDPIPLQGESGRIPVSVLFKKSSQSDGSGDNGDSSGKTSVTTDYSTLTAAGSYDASKKTGTPLQVTATDAYYVAGFDIQCTPTKEFISEWQYRTYLKIMDGYKQKTDEYYAQVGQGTEQSEDAANITNDIEWQQIKTKCIRLFWKRYKDLVVGSETKNDNNPTQSMINVPRYLQFFENTFEWNQMTYYLSPDYGEAENYNIDLIGTGFQDFLRAKNARILLPVVPERTYAVLYFLVTGMIWPGKDHLAPALDVNMSIIENLKAMTRTAPLGALLFKPDIIAEPWEITVPTSMTVLQESKELPEFFVEEE